MKKKTFDAVAFMQRRREEVSRAYAALGWRQIEERIQQALKDNPLWRQGPQQQSTSSPKKSIGHEWRFLKPCICLFSRLLKISHSD
jgi:hypothetical protein